MKAIVIILLFLTSLAQAQVSPVARFFNSHIGLYKVDTSTYQDPDAQKFIDSAGITDATQKAAIFRLVADFKGVPNALYYTTNIWDSIKAAYPFVGGTATTHKWNLKSPYNEDTSFRLTFYNSPTHDANGVTFNGTTNYADTYLVPSTNFNGLTANLFVYSRTASAGVSGHFETDMGVQNAPSVDSPSHFFRLFIRRSSNAGALNITGTAGTYSLGVTNAASGLGAYAGNLYNATATYYRNGNSIGSTTSAAYPPTAPAYSIYIGAIHNPLIAGGVGPDTYVARNFAFALISKGLTRLQHLALYNAVQQFEKTLGRSVN